MEKKLDPTETELEILKILWRQGPSSVKAVNQELNQKKITGYTTTLKIMQIMHAKDLVTRDESQRQHIYHAAIAENQVKQGFIKKMMKNLYAGSASQMVMQILGSGSASAKELEEIKNFITKIEDEQNGR